MSSPIEHTILIRADAPRIYRALIDRGDIAAWWGQVSDSDLAGDGLWAGVDRGDPVSIESAEPDRSLRLSLTQRHPLEEGVVADTTITFGIVPHADYCLLTVTQTGLPESAWSELIREGWATTLVHLQAWLERDRSTRMLEDPSRFAAIQREITVPAARAASWKAITNAEIMRLWLADNDPVAVSCDPAIGGAIDIHWSDDSHVGGEAVLSTPVSDWVVHWWDADSLARNDDPGMITVQHWHVASTDDGGSTIRLTETGYDLTKVDADYLQSIEEGWDMFMGSLQELLTLGR